MTTINANNFVSVNPGVLAAGGSGLVLNGLLLTKSTRVPIGTVMSFPSGPAVASFFGGSSIEAAVAQGGPGLGSGYFGGYDTSTIKPGAMLVAQYNTSNVAAYLRGGSISALALSALQAFNGTLSLTIDGVLQTGNVNLSGATSFTNAAQITEGTLGISGVQHGTGTATIAGNVMTVSAVLTGGTPFAVGDKITGASVTANSFISSFGTGTGGAGTYNLTQASTVAAPETVTSFAPAVSFDSVSGAFVISSGTTGANSTMTLASGIMATDLLLTQAAGAVLSQGAVAAVPATFMNAVISLNRNWVSFMTAFDPDGGVGFVNKLAFSAWTNSQNNRYVYVPFDTDATPTTQNPATASYGAAVTAASYSGTSLQWEPTDQNLVAFVCGSIASINFNQAGGRIAFAYKSQTGLQAGVTTDTAAINLGGNPQVSGDRGNGYNYYGAIATANQSFTDYQRGFVSGPFLWLDTYVNQIALNSDMQLALMTLQQQANSIPFNAAGDGQIEASLKDTIQKYVAFGAIVPGVSLSSSQISQINTAAGGRNIAPTLSNQGWYLLIAPAPTTVRQARGPRAITFFYVDGESVQSFSLSSVVLQ
jgi:hypothetical protein